MIKYARLTIAYIVRNAKSNTNLNEFLVMLKNKMTIEKLICEKEVQPEKKNEKCKVLFNNSRFFYVLP